MLRLAVYGVALLTMVAGAAQSAPPSVAPAGAMSCSGCHTGNAAAQSPVPRLAGRPAGDITTAMQAFRNGQRPATVMDRIAKGFSDSEVADIAAWYAAQKD